MFEFLGCQIDAPVKQMSAIVRTESSGNPFAVGIVGHFLNRQPQNLGEAKKLIVSLREARHNYSVGLAQVNQVNFAAYGLNANNMFDKCTNLRVGSQILKACYDKYQDWSKAYSCYYSGDAVTGYRHGYVAKVLKNIRQPILTSLSNQPYSTEPIVITPRGGKAAPQKQPSLKNRRLQSSLSTLTNT